VGSILNDKVRRYLTISIPLFTLAIKEIAPG
jgi:hypothetical protein